jgi:hypothetical protein
VRHASAGVVWVIGRTQLQSRGGRELQATAPRWEHVRSTTTASDAVMASSMAVLHLAAEPRSHMAVTLHAGTVPRYPARCLRASPEHPTPTLRGEHAISLISWQAQPRCQPSSKQRIAWVLFFFEYGLHPSRGPPPRTTRRLPQPARLLAVAVAGCISRSWCGEDSRWPARVLGELCGQTPPQH